MGVGLGTVGATHLLEIAVGAGHGHAKGVGRVATVVADCAESSFFGAGLFSVTTAAGLFTFTVGGLVIAATWETLEGFVRVLTDLIRKNRPKATAMVTAKATEAIGRTLFIRAFAKAHRSPGSAGLGFNLGSFGCTFRRVSLRGRRRFIGKLLRSYTMECIFQNE